MRVADDAVDAPAVRLDPERQRVVADKLALLAVPDDGLVGIGRIVEPLQEVLLGLGEDVVELAGQRGVVFEYRFLHGHDAVDRVVAGALVPLRLQPVGVRKQPVGLSGSARRLLPAGPGRPGTADPRVTGKGDVDAAILEHGRDGSALR